MPDNLYGGLGELPDADDIPAAAGDPGMFDGLEEIEDEDTDLEEAVPVVEDVPAAVAAPVVAEAGLAAQVNALEQEPEEDPEPVVPADFGERPKRRRAPRPAAPQVDRRAAVDSVIALLGAAGALKATGTGEHAKPSVLPSARARQVIETLVQAGTIEALDAQQPNLKQMAADLFDWDSPKFTRATKQVVKAFGRAVLFRDENGVSRYPQAVEMLAFASACAPLLQPDRLARLIDAGPTVATAWAPDRYTMALASPLRTVLGRYAEARREELLLSLWQASHSGRWWDITAGIGDDSPRRRQRRDEEARERADEAEAQVREVLDGRRAGTLAADRALVGALAEGVLPYNPATRHHVALIKQRRELRLALTDLVEHRDPDVPLLISHVPWLAPAERPTSPIVKLARTLQSALVPDAEGEVLIPELPEKPKSWAELYPKAELKRYPYPKEIFALDGTVLPGTGRNGVPAAHVELITTPAALADNRDYMGNCTWGYNEPCKLGQRVIGKVWVGPDCYNFGWSRLAGTYRTNEVNSRFNRGGVPPSVVQGLEQLANSIRVAP